MKERGIGILLLYALIGNHDGSLSDANGARLGHRKQAHIHNSINGCLGHVSVQAIGEYGLWCDSQMKNVLLPGYKKIKNC
jgi:hypothetical protein